MDRIFFENIRCFATRQEARLAPLTVLVGENSSGKSTFLALVRLAWDLVRRPSILDFNEVPFQFGAFDQIVSSVSSRPKKRKELLVGLETTVRDKEHEAVTVIGRFGPSQGQPALQGCFIKSGPYEITASFKEVGVIGSITIQLPSSQHTPSGQHIEESSFRIRDLRDLPLLLLWEGEMPQSIQEELEILTVRLRRIGRALGPRPYAFAPVRTQPERTYNPVQPLENPEGSHIPMILASTVLRDQEEWRRVAAAIESFGRQSGLFDRVEVRHMGKLDSDPFQIQIRIGGSARNLIDVGYGVSQVLPIIVDCLRGERGGTFLLQQPEIHLHPSAQAELGSFLGVLAKEQDKRFVIETHSDYLVDRIRMDIRDRKGITPEDVSLLYFERRNGEAHIHSLTLDDQGNILDPPPGYRSFFLEEERRFLGG
jgi:putative AbiEii toxin of type IV toxin-antitoxin system/uncharacterized protein DUF3696